MKIDTTRPARMYRHVADQLETAIRRGELKPGDPLPKEHELAEMFAAGRTTVREALRVLEEKGLLEVRVGAGGGAWVKAPDPGKMAEVLDLLMTLKGVDFDHLAEFRAEVESVVAGLAAARIDEPGRERLAQLVGRTRLALDAGDHGEFLRADADAHIALAELAGNPVFESIVRMVHENVLEAADRFKITEQETLTENHRDLAEMLLAVSQGDADLARRLAREHVGKYNRLMKYRQGHGEDKGEEQ